jgi:hypothetical protein
MGMCGVNQYLHIPALLPRGCKLQNFLGQKQFVKEASGAFCVLLFFTFGAWKTKW